MSILSVALIAFGALVLRTTVGADTTPGEVVTPTVLDNELEAEVAAPPSTDLLLSATGIGQTVVGEPGEDVIAALTAEFGEADESGFLTADQEPGLCPGEAGRTVRWGAFMVLLSQPQGGGGQTLAGYRLDASIGSPAHPASGLATEAGLRLGDSVATLESLYGHDRLSYFVTPAGNFYRIDAGSPNALWGPLSSTEPNGIVLGIYAPEPCQSSEVFGALSAATDTAETGTPYSPPEPGP